ncbi:RDD family protein [Saccharicrinis sp. FJH54]|uniref:RDD family protein n=1 Tax=Saccharicrinis sp. FJH54 TaxID=3344665 RepID=UPI0035D4265A
MNNQHVEFVVERDISRPGKNKFRIINSGSQDKKDVADYRSTFQMPTIRRRYVSTLVDACSIVVLALSVSYLFEVIENVPGIIRGISFFLVIFLYEPILISTGSTFGQLLTNIRVRKISAPDEKVGFFSAFLRFTVKVLLGWISFFTITFNKNRRGIHDYASSTVVLSMDGIQPGL